MAYMGKTKIRDMFIGARSELFLIARRMRNNPTKAEKILWNHLRKMRNEGFIFRRQHPVEFFIADFYCHKLKLVIEVDGEIHHNNATIIYDDNRSGELERFGIFVIRFNNNEVIENIDHVMTRIRNIIERLASPALLGAGDERG
jgi:very-short-patch-repair endonuclease